jgi:hypothetical protein
MGTISTASAAMDLSKEELSGIVLTSSVTSQKILGAVPWRNLELVRVPVLVLHHESDACRICVPGDASQIIRRLDNAPVKKEIYVKGGANPKGDPCEALHWHGFIGMEGEAVDLIAGWIRHPVP